MSFPCPRRAVLVALGALCAVTAVAIPVPLGAQEQALQTRPVVAGYYVDFDPLSWSTVQRRGPLLDWVITTNFDFVDHSGTLQGRHEQRIVDLVRRQGKKVHFRVANLTPAGFSRAVAHAVLTDPIARQRAIASIVQVMSDHGYDGVNVDLEKVPPGDRGALTTFVTSLRAEVSARGKALTIAVPGTTGVYLTDPSSGGFDLAALGGIVDRIIIMAYDEHWDTGEPGPVASQAWVEAVIRFTKTQVPAHKLLLGVALYGYDWPRHGPGEGLSMVEAVRRAAAAGAAVQWDDQAKVPFYRGPERIVYFENARSVGHKLAAARQQRLAGIAFWRLGHELPDVWDAVRRYAEGQAIAQDP